MKNTSTYPIQNNNNKSVLIDGKISIVWYRMFPTLRTYVLTSILVYTLQHGQHEPEITLVLDVRGGYTVRQYTVVVAHMGASESSQPSNLSQLPPLVH